MNKQYLGRLLVVDDDEIVREIFHTTLTAAGFVVSTANDIASMQAALKQMTYDAVLLDVFLGDDEDAIRALPFLVQNCPYTKIVMMSSEGTIELAMDAMRKGASTFIAKSKNPRELVAEIKKSLAHSTLQGSTPSERYGIIGNSPEIHHVLEQIERIKDVSSTVLIVGESGTGKELVARALHTTSKRANCRFEALNCGAIPRTLMESELFGHKRGAFTDAKADRKGIFELCEGGTVLLDEIGEMPPDLQVKLLRVLQEREVSPLGQGHATPIDVRVIAATNRNPFDDVRTGTFREDLYYRLAVMTIQLPSLRERKTDIPLLVRHFLTKMNKRFSRKVQPPSQELEARLLAYNWPGNVRELQNAVERGVILSKEGKLRVEDMLPVHSEQDARAKRGSQVFYDEFPSESLSDAKHGFEKEYLRQLLDVTHGNIAEVARISHRYRADVYRLLAKHSLEWTEFRI